MGFPICALAYFGRYPKVTDQLLRTRKSSDVSDPAAYRHGCRHADSRNRHQSLRLGTSCPAFASCFSTPIGLRPLSPIELDGTDLRGVVVKREWEHIDLLITSRQPSFVVAIENKVDSIEQNGQLHKYEKIVETGSGGIRNLHHGRSSCLSMAVPRGSAPDFIERRRRFIG